MYTQIDILIKIIYIILSYISNFFHCFYFFRRFYMYYYTYQSTYSYKCIKTYSLLSNIAGTNKWPGKNILNNVIKLFSEAPTAPGNGNEETAILSKDCIANISNTVYVDRWKALYTKKGTKNIAVICTIVMTKIWTTSFGFCFIYWAPLTYSSIWDIITFLELSTSFIILNLPNKFVIDIIKLFTSFLKI